MNLKLNVFWNLFFWTQYNHYWETWEIVIITLGKYIDKSFLTHHFIISVMVTWTYLCSAFFQNKIRWALFPILFTTKASVTELYITWKQKYIQCKYIYEQEISETYAKQSHLYIPKSMYCHWNHIIIMHNLIIQRICWNAGLNKENKTIKWINEYNSRWKDE